ncbi:MAG: succinylglutamate desuccinylase/aspartoacylase family protein [Sulfurovum sp.]|uniref:succinylglutamate desuccinylase/aspartoacylase family protein n=1 Tax=Sulfurovum sp. TaxID=1969726 RepID=UPI00286808AA|nr:M14 family metallopeptidase [Sulfurovum sp.]MCO4844752.1 succinylglutamate desuccinylase/aspartoacylase family protein [Sulfurovum sp.]
MQAEPFILGGVEIPKGTKQQLEIELPSFYGTPTTLTTYVIRGKKEGPIVFISAAIHGDELNGIEIIRRLRQLHLLSKLRGTLILVPIVNIYGAINLSRYLPDRRDLNRSFPGHSKGALASRVAKTFFDEIVSKCDLGIDLHTASIHKDNLPQIRTNTNNEYTLMLARAFEAPVVLHSELRDGSLRAVAQDKGIPILLYEAGEALRLDEKSIKIGVKGIINVLRANEMLPQLQRKKSTQIKTMLTKSSTWIRAQESGMIQTLKKLGDVVEEGEVIARIHSLFDDQEYELTTPFDGIIIGKTQIPLIHEGDAAFHIAALNDLKIAEERMEPFHQDERLTEISIEDQTIV